MRAIIVAGGHSSANDGWRHWAADADLIVGADGGAAQALAWGLSPDVVIGDLDSLPAETRATLVAAGREFVVHPRAKDETDLELALTYVVERGYQDVVILGALGGRLDHLLANILLLTLPGFAQARIRIADGAEEALLLRGGEMIEFEGQPGDVVSLLPLGGDAYRVTTHGLAWTLTGDTLHFGATRGVSNEMVAAAARVELEAGYLLIVHGPQPI
jgi:thiamine pyrophosphokinase